MIRNIKPWWGESLSILKPWLCIAGRGIGSSFWLMLAIFMLGRSPGYAISVANSANSVANSMANSANRSNGLNNSLILSQPPQLPEPIDYKTRHDCPADPQALSQQLTKDLYGYLTRTYTRLGFNTQVQLVSNPELEPLPLAAGSRDGIHNLKSPSSDSSRIVSATGIEQIFITLNTRAAGKTDTTKQAYWLFMTETKKGWRLAMVYTRIGNAPPHDVSDGAIADAVKTWLRDRCY